MNLKEALAALNEARVCAQYASYRPEERAQRFRDECERVLREYARDYNNQAILKCGQTMALELLEQQ